MSFLLYAQTSCFNVNCLSLNYNICLCEDLETRISLNLAVSLETKCIQAGCSSWHSSLLTSLISYVDGSDSCSCLTWRMLCEQCIVIDYIHNKVQGPLSLKCFMYHIQAYSSLAVKYFIYVVSQINSIVSFNVKIIIPSTNGKINFITSVLDRK